MKAHTLHAAILATALVAGAIGCGKDKSNPAAPQPAVTQEEADDVAIQTQFTFNIFGDDLGTAVASTPAGPAARPARALWDTTFSNGGGLTYEASRTFYDAADNPLADYGPTAVRLRWMSHASGLIHTPRDSATVGHALTLDVRGIQASDDTLKLDGTSADTLLNKFHSFDGTRTRLYYWRSSLQIINVRFAKDQIPTGPRPIGTATMTIAVDRLRSYDRLDVASHFDVSVVVTFDGSGVAVLVVDGRYTYHWDLDSGDVTRA
jgi:hypothetical protein